METAIDWAQRNGRLFHWHTELDNYSPVPRNSATGLGYMYRQDLQDRILLLDFDSLREAVNSMYIVDNGRTVIPHYVIGWRKDEYILLGQFPVNFDKNGAPILRDDDKRPVDFTNWVLGPRRAYHLKVTESGV